MKKYLTLAIPTILVLCVAAFVIVLEQYEDYGKKKETKKPKEHPPSHQTTYQTYSTYQTHETYKTSNVELTPEQAGKAMETASVKSAVEILQNAIATNSAARRSAMADALKRMPKEIVVRALHDEAAKSDGRTSVELNKVIREIQ